MELDIETEIIESDNAEICAPAPAPEPDIDLNNSLPPLCRVRREFESDMPACLAQKLNDATIAARNIYEANSNKYRKYRYTSINDYHIFVSELKGKCGITIVPSNKKPVITSGEKIREGSKEKAYIFAEREYIIYCSDCGKRSNDTISGFTTQEYVDATSFKTANSYMDADFYRSLFNIPTSDNPTEIKKLSDVREQVSTAIAEVTDKMLPETESSGEYIVRNISGSVYKSVEKISDWLEIINTLISMNEIDINALLEANKPEIDKILEIVEGFPDNQKGKSLALNAFRNLQRQSSGSNLAEAMLEHNMDSD